MLNRKVVTFTACEQLVLFTDGVMKTLRVMRLAWLYHSTYRKHRLFSSRLYTLRKMFFPLALEY